MTNLFDDAARILAGPLLRRQALKALGRVLAGSLLAAFGVRQAESQANGGNSSPCRPACGRDQICCPGGGGQAFCIGSGRLCCGNESCGPGSACCTGSNGQKFCSGAGKTCCGDTSCGPGSICCTGPRGSRFCAGEGRRCCGATSCGPAEECCTTGSEPFCALRGASCCGNTSCGRTETCCANTVCCGANQACKNGRCEVSRS